MNRAIALLTGAGLGAGLMYFLDPRAGRRRRTTLRDRTIRMARETREAARVISCDMRNRCRGWRPATCRCSSAVGGR